RVELTCAADAEIDVEHALRVRAAARDLDRALARVEPGDVARVARDVERETPVAGADVEHVGAAEARRAAERLRLASRARMTHDDDNAARPRVDRAGHVRGVGCGISGTWPRR